MIFHFAQRALICLFLIVFGFAGGAYYVSRKINSAVILGFGAEAAGQDAVLTALEKNDADTAKKILARQLQLSLAQLQGQEKESLPPEVQAILKKRQPGPP